MTRARSIIATALAGLLSACAVSSPLQVTSNGAGAAPRSGVELPDLAEEPAEERRAFANALQRALVAQSVRVAAESPLLAEYSFSIGEATGGTVAGKGDDVTAGAEPDWIAEPRNKHWLDRCDAQRMRGTLVLFSRTDGSIVYHGEASQIACSFSDEDITALSNALVADAFSPKPAS